MEFDDLYVGMRVRITDWMEIDGYRPDHWHPEGEMDDWCGEEVTIDELLTSVELVFIEEDEGKWEWFPGDFEHLVQLSPDDPNMKFPSHKIGKRLENLRKALDAKANEALKGVTAKL